MLSAGLVSLTAQPAVRVIYTRKASHARYLCEDNRDYITSESIGGRIYSIFLI